MTLESVNRTRVSRGELAAFKCKVANRLREHRGRRNQEIFARSTPVTQQQISKYEAGEIPRSWLFLAALRENEGVDLNEFLSLNGVED